MKLGVFGGTFDPPHVGHLIVAEDAAAALSLDRILFVPTAGSSSPVVGPGQSGCLGATRDVGRYAGLGTRCP